MLYGCAAVFSGNGLEVSAKHMEAVVGAEDLTAVFAYKKMFAVLKDFRCSPVAGSDTPVDISGNITTEKRVVVRVGSNCHDVIPSGLSRDVAAQ